MNAATVGARLEQLKEQNADLEQRKMLLEHQTRDQPQQPNPTELTKLANNLHHLLTTASHAQTKALLHDLIHHITITAPGK